VAKHKPTHDTEFAIRIPVSRGQLTTPFVSDICVVYFEVAMRRPSTARSAARE